MIRVRCIKPPVINQAEGVKLWHAGDEEPIEVITGYWQGLADRGVVEIIETEELEEAPEGQGDDTASKAKRGRKTKESPEGQGDDTASKAKRGRKTKESPEGQGDDTASKAKRGRKTKESPEGQGEVE